MKTLSENQQVSVKMILTKYKDSDDVKIQQMLKGLMDQQMSSPLKDHINSVMSMLSAQHNSWANIILAAQKKLQEDDTDKQQRFALEQSIDRATQERGACLRCIDELKDYKNTYEGDELQILQACKSSKLLFKNFYYV